MKDCCKEALEKDLDICPECGVNIKIIKIRLERIKEANNGNN